MLHLQVNGGHNPREAIHFTIAVSSPSPPWIFCYETATSGDSSALPHSCTPLTQGFTATLREPYGVICSSFPSPFPIKAETFNGQLPLRHTWIYKHLATQEPAALAMFFNLSGLTADSAWIQSVSDFQS